MQTRTLLAGLAALTVCGAASADVITAAGITYTGSGVEDVFPDESRLIDGSGLSAPLAADESNLASVTHGGPSAANAWVTNDPGAPAGDYFVESGGATISFEIDLGGTFVLDQFASWGYGFGSTNGNSISDITLDFSIDGGANYLSSQNVSVALVFGAADISALTPVTANYVRLTVNDNHFGGGAASGGGDRVGLAEIAFTGDVPEPGSLALLGLGTLLIARRRRA